MAVRAGYEFNSLLLGVGDHLVDGWIEEGFPPIPEEDQKNIISYFIDNFLVKIKIHMPTRSIHPCGDRAKGTPKVAAVSGFYLKVGRPTPRTFRLEIDRGFDKEPVEDLLKGDVLEIVRNAVALDPHLPSR
jgi:hypothetical protein